MQNVITFNTYCYFEYAVISVAYFVSKRYQDQYYSGYFITHKKEKQNSFTILYSHWELIEKVLLNMRNTIRDTFNRFHIILPTCNFKIMFDTSL